MVQRAYEPPAVFVWNGVDCMLFAPQLEGGSAEFCVDLDVGINLVKLSALVLGIEIDYDDVTGFASPTGEYLQSIGTVELQFSIEASPQPFQVVEEYPTEYDGIIGCLFH